ncbi:Endonuclease/exonuclease/phosphatase, partial [Parasponia andersonii]
PIVVVTIGDEILGHKDLFPFHKKDIVADSSLAPNAKSFADVVLNKKTMVMPLPSTSSILQQKGAYVSVKEFWHPQILFDLAKASGVPLKIDQATLNGDFGHFARVLVDIDLKNPLLDMTVVLFISLRRDFPIFVLLVPLLAMFLLIVVSKDVQKSPDVPVKKIFTFLASVLDKDNTFVRFGNMEDEVKIVDSLEKNKAHYDKDDELVAIDENNLRVTIIWTLVISLKPRSSHQNMRVGKKCSLRKRKKLLKLSTLSLSRGLRKPFLNEGPLLELSGFVYASCDYIVRRELWDSLSSLHVTGPWLVLGDFNSVMGTHETTGIIKGRSCEDFRVSVTLCNMIDLDSQGPLFIWRGSRGGRLVMSRLDKAFYNEELL